MVCYQTGLMVASAIYNIIDTSPQAALNSGWFEAHLCLTVRFLLQRSLCYIYSSRFLLVLNCSFKNADSSGTRVDSGGSSRTPFQSKICIMENLLISTDSNNLLSKAVSYNSHFESIFLLPPIQCVFCSVTVTEARYRN